MPYKCRYPFNLSIKSINQVSDYSLMSDVHLIIDLLSTMCKRCLRSRSTLSPVDIILFERLVEEYQASLIKTKYWISGVMNVHCRLIEVNAASAGSEHLSYLKGNGIANGFLMNSMAKQGESCCLSQADLALSG